MGSTAIQWMLAEAKAGRIIAACEKYKAVNGSYPKGLDELVPKYLPSIPPAKYCLIEGTFDYCSFDGRATLWWYKIPPFGREIYDFQDGHWGYLD
jgi:hypothetical protein